MQLKRPSLATVVVVVSAAVFYWGLTLLIWSATGEWPDLWGLLAAAFIGLGLGGLAAGWKRQ